MFCAHHTAMRQFTPSVILSSLKPHTQGAWVFLCHPAATYTFGRLTGIFFLHATSVTRGWTGYQNKSQHKKVTIENKILTQFLPELMPMTDLSIRVQCSTTELSPLPWHHHEGIAPPLLTLITVSLQHFISLSFSSFPTHTHTRLVHASIAHTNTHDTHSHTGKPYSDLFSVQRENDGSWQQI